MFGERGYLAFPTRAFAGKPPQGFMAWCCSCCCPRRRREVPKTVRRVPSETENTKLQQELSQDDSSTNIGKVDQVPVIQVEHSTTISEKRSVSKNVVQEEIRTSTPKKQGVATTPEEGKRKWIDIPLFKRRRYSVDETMLLPEDNVVKNPRKTRTLDSLGRRSGRDVEIPVLKIYTADGSEYSEEGKQFCIICSKSLKNVHLYGMSKKY